MYTLRQAGASAANPRDSRWHPSFVRSSSKSLRGLRIKSLGASMWFN